MLISCIFNLSTTAASLQQPVLWLLKGACYKEVVLYLLCIGTDSGLYEKCGSWSDAAEHGVWSGSTLFFNHLAVFKHISGV